MKKLILFGLLLLTLLSPTNNASAAFHSAEILMLNKHQKTALSPGEYMIFTSSGGIYRVTTQKDEEFTNKQDDWVIIVQPTEEDDEEETGVPNLSTERLIAI
jgi:hypothetical protein